MQDSSPEWYAFRVSWTVNSESLGDHFRWGNDELNLIFVPKQMNSKYKNRLWQRGFVVVAILDVAGMETVRYHLFAL
ncbi:hypothetical protein TNCV_939331 [Trichonephila clavipes]|nr:hypothetical protein TNCV_939331 [Trichonephila clavipes]